MIISQKLSEFTKSDHTVNILIYLYAPGQTRAKISTEFFVKPAEWSGEVLATRPNAHYINAVIRGKMLDIEKYWMNNQNLSPKEVKAWFVAQAITHPVIVEQEPVKYTSLTYMDYFIECCEKGIILKKKTKERLSDSSITNFKTCANVFRGFPGSARIQFNDLSEDFYNAFVVHMRDVKNYKQNYIAKTVKKFIEIMLHAKKKQHHFNEACNDYFISWEKVFKLKLTKKEVEAISTIDLSDEPELIPEQERFQVAYNFLLRFRDSISISEKNIIFRNDKPLLSLTTGKTKEPVLIPIQDRVYKILKKNNFKIKGCNFKSNLKLKRIAMKAKVNDKVVITEFIKGKKIEVVYEKWQLVETHTTRRSGARHLFEAGMRTHIIMALGGWRTEEQLLEYIDIDKEFAANEAAGFDFFK